MTALFVRDVRLGVRAGGGLVGVLFFLAVAMLISFIGVLERWWWLAIAGLVLTIGALASWQRLVLLGPGGSE